MNDINSGKEKKSVRNVSKKKKRIILIIIALLFIALVVYKIPAKTSLNGTLTGEKGDTVTISAEVFTQKNFFGPDSYYGDVRIDGMPCKIQKEYQENGKKSFDLGAKFADITSGSSSYSVTSYRNDNGYVIPLITLRIDGKNIVDADVYDMFGNFLGVYK